MAAYATLAEANAYFALKLHTEVWDASDNIIRGKALSEASLMLGRLNYGGDKTDPSQELEFPRSGDTDIPTDIKYACSELAYALLDGVEIDRELADVGVKAQGYASVRSTYDTAIARDHIAAGIPSATAWRFLLPYLRDPRSFLLVRVN